MKRVLITGSGSYVGGWVRRRLEEEPGKYAVDELSVRGDAWRSLDFSPYDSMFHVAGIAHVSAGPSMEGEYMRVNRDLAIEVGERAKERGAGQVVFMSSAIVYGDAAPAGKGRPITSETPPNPANFYGRSKLEAEEGLRALEGEGFKVAVLRAPMVYGPGCTRGNFPLLVKMAKRLPFFPDIDNRRSMIYVKNLAELVAQIIAHDDAGLFMPQNGVHVRTSDLVKTVAAESGRRMALTKVFNPVLGTVLVNTTVVKKAFGDLFFANEAAAPGYGYCVYDLAGSVHDIALEEGWAR